MTIGNATLRGGQTLLHDARMWGQLARWGVVGLVLAIVLTPAVSLFTTTSAHEWRVVGLGTLAEAKLAIGYSPDSGQVYEWGEGVQVIESISLIASDPRIERTRMRFLAIIHKKAWLGLWLGLSCVAVFIVTFWLLGRRMARARRIRGAEMTSAKALARSVTPLFSRLTGRFFPAARKSTPRIAGVPWPKRAETQHTIVSGTTGSGKTVLISDLVSQIRERGERCILYDKMGSYTRAFFDPARDVLMNPLDARAPRWSPFLEAKTPRDFDTMAAALIPQQKDTVDPFWVTAARQLFANGAGVLWKRGVTENRILVEHLLKTELTSLAEAMEGTVAQSIVDPENPKTALSVRAMLTAHLGALECLPDSGVPFSIREWVEREDETGFLSLTSRGDQHASLRGLISTWLEIAVNALLSLGRDDARRIWIVLDELPTLHQVPSLQPGLAESRQFGGCFVLGVQVISALRDLYGRNGAETVSGLCGTRVVLAAPDQETARWSAESLGRGEVTEYAEGLSYGASTMRDGVSLTQRREMRPLALPSEIMRLENLHGYLKFPGPWPVARVRLDYVKRPRAAESFIPRANAPLLEAGGAKSAGTGPSGKKHESKRAAEPGEATNQLKLELPGDATGNDEAEAERERPAPPPDAGVAGPDQAPGTSGAPPPAAHSAEGDDAGAAGSDERKRGEDGKEARSRTPDWL